MGLLFQSAIEKGSTRHLFPRGWMIDTNWSNRIKKKETQIKNAEHQKKQNTLVERLAKKWSKKVESKNEQLEIYIRSPAFALSPICSSFMVNGIDK